MRVGTWLESPGRQKESVSADSIGRTCWSNYNQEARQLPCAIASIENGFTAEGAENAETDGTTTFSLLSALSAVHQVALLLHVDPLPRPAL